jgi:hypothetical protein
MGCPNSPILPGFFSPVRRSPKPEWAGLKTGRTARFDSSMCDASMKPEKKSRQNLNLFIPDLENV